MGMADGTGVHEAQRESRLPDLAALDLDLSPVEVLQRTGVPVAVTRAAPGESRARVAFVNDSMVRLLGYDRKELLGHGPALWHSSARDVADLKAIGRALRAGRTVSLATVARCKDGSQRALRVEMVPHKGSWGLWVISSVLHVDKEPTPSSRSQAEPPDRLHVGDLTLDVPTRRALCHDRVTELTHSECVVLATLMREVGCAVERAVLYDELWGADPSIRSRAIDVYVGSLRRKLAELGKKDLIRTVRGVGYLVHE